VDVGGIERLKANGVNCDMTNFVTSVVTRKGRILPDVPMRIRCVAIDAATGGLAATKHRRELY
jgi:hypothetical protein